MFSGKTKRAQSRSLTPKNRGSCLGLHLLGTPLSSFRTLSPHRIPLLFPLLYLIPPLLPSPAWLSEPILSLSHLNVNLRKITCTVYIIYIWFLWFSVTLTSWCATYLHLQNSPSSLCNSLEEQPQPSSWGSWMESGSVSPSPAPRRSEWIILADRTV